MATLRFAIIDRKWTNLGFGQMDIGKTISVESRITLGK